MPATTIPTAKRSAKTETTEPLVRPHMRGSGRPRRPASAKEIADSIDSGSPSAGRGRTRHRSSLLFTPAPTGPRDRLAGVSISSRERVAWSDRWHRIRGLHCQEEHAPGVLDDRAFSDARSGSRGTGQRPPCSACPRPPSGFDPWRGFRFSTYACKRHPAGHGPQQPPGEYPPASLPAAARDVGRSSRSVPTGTRSCTSNGSTGHWTTTSVS